MRKYRIYRKFHIHLQWYVSVEHQYTHQGARFGRFVIVDYMMSIYVW